MSIATLKKKTAAKYNNNSVNVPLFSLNGTHRNQGYVGQDSLSRFTSRTLVRNGGLRNHGGCCGTFTIGQPVVSGIKTTENSNIVKNSVLTTDGLIQTKYRWIRRPQPYAVVKNDYNNNVNTQCDHIVIIRNNAISEAAACYKVPNCQNDLSGCKTPHNYAKPINNYIGYGATPHYNGVAIDQSDYIILKDIKCALQNKVAILNNNSGKPFSGSV